VHHEPGRLVEDDQVRVLVDDRERNVVGFERAVGLARQRLDVDPLVAEQARVGSERPVVGPDGAEPDPALDPGTRERLDTVGQRAR
jgi:hypothetical protein